MNEKGRRLASLPAAFPRFIFVCCCSQLDLDPLCETSTLFIHDKVKGLANIPTAQLFIGYHIIHTIALSSIYCITIITMHCYPCRKQQPPPPRLGLVTSIALLGFLLSLSSLVVVVVNAEERTTRSNRIAENHTTPKLKMRRLRVRPDIYQVTDDTTNHRDNNQNDRSSGFTTTATTETKTIDGLSNKMNQEKVGAEELVVVAGVAGLLLEQQQHEPIERYLQSMSMSMVEDSRIRRLDLEESMSMSMDIVGRRFLQEMSMSM